MEPDESTEDRRRSGIKDEDKVLLPLDENVLTDNLGIPVVVVVTKVGMRQVYLGGVRLGYSRIRIYSGIKLFWLFCSWEQNSQNGNPGIPE